MSSQDLKNKQSLTSLLGPDVSVSWKGSDLYINNSLVILTDVPCTNGVLYVLDQVLFPPSGQ
ncbi:fasciclin domain-containing protein [Vibrio parahaemolyticus]